MTKLAHSYACEGALPINWTFNFFIVFMYRAVKKWQGIARFMFKCEVNIAMFAVQVINKQGWMFLAMKKQKSIIDVYRL